MSEPLRGNILVTGGRGQLATAIKDAWGGRTGNDFQFTDNGSFDPALPSAEFDIADAQAVRIMMAYYVPNVIINCVAIHNLADCEGEGRELSHAVNVGGVVNLIQHMPDDCRLIQIGTDYVFGDDTDEPRDEFSATNPMNAYGEQKLEAEGHVLTSGSGTVVRTASLWSAVGSRMKGDSNFFLGMVGRALNDKPMLVTDAIYMSPTYAPHLARLLLKMVETHLSGQCIDGIFHVTNAWYCSWLEFAKEMFWMADCPKLAGRVEMRSPEDDLEDFQNGPRRPKSTPMMSERTFMRNNRLPSWKRSIAHHFMTPEGQQTLHQLRVKELSL